MNDKKNRDYFEKKMNEYFSAGDKGKAEAYKQAFIAMSVQDNVNKRLYEVEEEVNSLNERLNAHSKWLTAISDELNKK